MSADIRRLGDKQGDNTAEMRLVRTEVATLTAAVGRLERLLEKQQDSGHLHRVLMVFEKAPWQSASALLAVVALILALTIGHVDLVALVAAYSHPKANP